MGVYLAIKLGAPGPRALASLEKFSGCITIPILPPTRNPCTGATIKGGILYLLVLFPRDVSQNGPILRPVFGPILRPAARKRADFAARKRAGFPARTGKAVACPGRESGPFSGREIVA